MSANMPQHSLGNFALFCSTVDIREVIAAADEDGNALGYEKELYALAIIRAAQSGAFGRENHGLQCAVSGLWERGYRFGFSRETFNAGFLEFCNPW
jgi:hypothetical protein